MMTWNELTTWCANTAAEFRTREHSMADEGRDRDTVLVEHVIGALADPDVAGTERLIEIIDRGRASMVAQ